MLRTIASRKTRFSLLSCCAALLASSIALAEEPAKVQPATAAATGGLTAEGPAAPAQSSSTAAPNPDEPMVVPQPPPRPAPKGWEGESAKDRLGAAQPDEADKIEVSLRGEEGDTFYAWVGDGRSTSNPTLLIDGAVYEQLCDAPCTAKLPPGRNRLAVSQGGSPVVANNEITLYGPSTLTADYSSYTGQRLLGTLVLVGGSVAGVALILTAPDCKEDPTDLSKPLECNNTQEYIGVGVGVASIVGGTLLLLKNDEVELSLSPGSGAPAPQGSVGFERLSGALQGLQFSGRF